MLPFVLYCNQFKRSLLPDSIVKKKEREKEREGQKIKNKRQEKQISWRRKVEDAERKAWRLFSWTEILNFEISYVDKEETIVMLKIPFFKLQ